MIEEEMVMVKKEEEVEDLPMLQLINLVILLVPCGQSSEQEYMYH